MSDIIIDEGFAERRIAEADRSAVNVLIDEANLQLQRIKSGRLVGFIVGGLTMGLGVYQYIETDLPWESGGVVVEGLLFVGLAFFLPRAPLACLGAMMGLYVLNVVIAVATVPSSIPQGLFMKGLVLYLLGKGIVAAYRLRGLRTDLRAKGMGEAALSPHRRLEVVELV